MAELPKLLSPGPVPTSTSASGTSVGGSAGKLPKINRNDVLRATNQTFVQPALNKVTSGFRALNPVNMARQWAYANPVTSKLIDFKANIDDNRSERDRPMREARASRGSADDNAGWRDARRGVWNPINEARGGGEGGMGGDVSAVVEAVDRLRDANISSFTGLISELRAIRSNSITIVRNTNMSFGEQKKTNANLINLAEMIKDLNSSRGPSLEDRIEGNRGTATEAEIGNKPESLIKSLIGMLLGGAAAFASKFMAGLAAAALLVKNGFGAITSGVNKLFATARLGVLVLAQELRVGLGALGTRFASIFKAIQVPKSLVAVGTSISATFGKFVASLSGVAKALLPMGRLGGVVAKLGGFLKFIPVVGQFILVASAIFDGIKGFISGWSGTDGSFMERAWGGLKGAVVGIVKGFIAPFKWLGEVLWKGIRGIGEALGLGKFIKQLESIDFGALFGKVVSAFDPASVVGKVADWFFDFIKGLADKFLGAGAAVVNGVVDAARGAGEAVQNVQNVASDVVEAVGGGANRVADALPFVGNRTDRRELETYVAKEARSSGMTGNELAMFMAQTHHETGGFKSLEEGKYSANRVWQMRGSELSKRGVSRNDVMSAERSGGREAMYEYMYADKYRGRGYQMGNTQAGDGARFKGRGIVQLTGRNNYREIGREIGLDLESNPELAADPEVAMKIALHFWKKNNIAQSARNGDVARATRLLNGGQNGIADRRNQYNKYLRDLQDGKLDAELRPGGVPSGATNTNPFSTPARTNTTPAWRPPSGSNSLTRDAANRVNRNTTPSWANGQVRNQADGLNAAERDRNAYARNLVFQPPSNSTTVVAPVTNNVRQTNVRTSGGGTRYDRGTLDSSPRF